MEASELEKKPIHEDEATRKTSVVELNAEGTVSDVLVNASGHRNLYHLQ
jgi:hypothetical protein